MSQRRISGVRGYHEPQFKEAVKTDLPYFLCGGFPSDIWEEIAYCLYVRDMNYSVKLRHRSTCSVVLAAGRCARELGLNIAGDKPTRYKSNGE